jgi:ankyrin repeat protein
MINHEDKLAQNKSPADPQQKKEKEKEKEKENTPTHPEESQASSKLPLPAEIMCIFAFFFEIPDVLRLSLAHSELYFLASDNHVWKSLFARDFYHYFSEEFKQKIIQNGSKGIEQYWFSLYRKCYTAIKNSVDIPEQYRPLFICAYMGDATAINSLLAVMLAAEKSGENIPDGNTYLTNLKDKQGYRLLDIARDNNQFGVVEVLLSRLHYVNLQEIYSFALNMSTNIPEKYRPLFIQVYLGNASAIDKLLAKLFALEKNEEEKCEDNLALLELKNNKESSLLEIAAANGHVAVIKILFSYIQFPSVFAAHQAAMKNGHLAVVMYMFNHWELYKDQSILKGDVVAVLAIDPQLLSSATTYSSLNFLLQQHSKGKEPSVLRLLSKATELQLSESVQYLIEEKGGDALVEAILSDNTSALTYLVEQEGVAVNKTDSYGTTPLIVAVVTGNIDIANYLITRGAALLQDNKIISAAVYSENPNMIA